MSKRALCVGINRFAEFPQFELRGCVNDAQEMAALARSHLGFRKQEVTVLTDAQATKAAIAAALKAAVADARAGRIDHLLFSLSSHGTQMKDENGDEPDGMDEAFVPYDIAQKGDQWDRAHILSDDELNALFARLPAKVSLEVFLDTCHSGSGLRGAEFSLNAPRPRYVAPPLGELQGPVKQRAVRGFMLQTPRAAPRKTGATRGAAQPVTMTATATTPTTTTASTASPAPADDTAPRILWTGCKANQTSADAFFAGRFNGAFTRAFVDTMKAGGPERSRQQVIAAVRAALKGKFAQIPQLEAKATDRKAVILY